MNAPADRIILGRVLGVCGGALLAASFFMPTVAGTQSAESLAQHMFAERGSSHRQRLSGRDTLSIGILVIWRSGFNLDWKESIIPLVLFLLACPSVYGCVAIVRIVRSWRGRLDRPGGFRFLAEVNGLLGLILQAVALERMYWVHAGGHALRPLIPIWAVGFLVFVRLLWLRGKVSWSEERLAIAGQLAVGVQAMTWPQFHYAPRWALEQPEILEISLAFYGLSAMMLAGLLLSLGAFLEDSAGGPVVAST
ncbi:MAG: hypothetical protein HZA54_15100 [Planctomycetes bacterium]|nr:hypothetical protein [Planctomycetota bacterium]